MAQSIRARIASYTEDPLIGRMWQAIRAAGPIRSISLDITRRCNLRCKGCYFFAENMDVADEVNEAAFDAFIERELTRGTDTVTVLGGEPSLSLQRLRKLAVRFRLMVVTNGLRPIPRDGLEDCAISVWGDRASDIELRGYGKIDVFGRSLSHYRDDDRAIWYITLPTDPPPQTAEVVQRCVENGNLVGFNFYGDLQSVGGRFDHRRGFYGARDFISRMIEAYPDRIAFNRYLGQVIDGGRMKGEAWRYATCASVSVDDPHNAERLKNGRPFAPRFNAYGPSLEPRRCCVGEERDCETCFDVWAYVSWIALGLERHLETAQDFFDWISTIYIFYAVLGRADRKTLQAVLPPSGHHVPKGEGTPRLRKPAFHPIRTRVRHRRGARVDGGRLLVRLMWAMSCRRGAKSAISERIPAQLYPPSICGYTKNQSKSEC